MEARRGQRVIKLLMHQEKTAFRPEFMSEVFVTGHEHLDEQQLIHMNGRIYDYNLGRFLSVDPLVHGSGNSQGINPYSYILNNPLSGTDPTGYEPKQKEGTSNPCKQGDDKGCGPHEHGDGQTVNDGNGEENGGQGDKNRQLTQQERRVIARCVQNKGGCDTAVKILKDKLKGGSNNKNKKIDDPNGNKSGDEKGDNKEEQAKSLSRMPGMQGLSDFQMLNDSQEICASACIVIQFSVTGGAFHVLNGEGGAVYAFDASSGQIHIFKYYGVGLGVGPIPAGLAVTGEVGLMTQTTIGTFTGSGYSVNAIAAAGPGATAQFFGNGKDAMGFTVGAAGGIAAGVSGLITYTYYQGSFSLYETEP